MSKYHNDVNITSGRRVYVQEPIDDRIVFQGRSDVEADIASEQCLRWYEGMQMVLNDEAEIYIWLPIDNIPQSTAILDYSRFTFRTDFPDPLYAGREFAFVRRTYVQLKHSELTLDDGTNPHGTTKADVGLGNVDNTPDNLKPISQPQQTALDTKEPILGKPSADGQFLAGTVSGLRYWAASPQSISDAPSDNRIYGRINQLWQEILALKVGYNDSVTGLIQGPSNVQNAIEALVEQINALASGRRFLGIHDSDTFPTIPPDGGYIAGDYYIVSNTHDIVLPGDTLPTFFGNGDWMVSEVNNNVVTWSRFVPTKSRQPIEPFDNTKVYPVNSIVSENDILWANFGTTSIQPGAFDPTQWLQLTYSQSTDRPSDFISQQWIIPATPGDEDVWYRVASFDPLGPKFILKLLLFLDNQTVDIEFIGSNAASIGLMNTICSDPGITINSTLDLDDLLPIRGIGIERVSDTEYYVIVQPTLNAVETNVRAEIYIVDQNMELTNPVEITVPTIATSPPNQQLVQWIGNVIVAYRGSSGYGLEGYYLPYTRAAGFKPNDRTYAQQRDIIGRYVDKYEIVTTDTDISAITNQLDFSYHINPVADMSFTLPIDAPDNTRIVLHLFKSAFELTIIPASTDRLYATKTNIATGTGVNLVFTNYNSQVLEFLYDDSTSTWYYTELAGFYNVAYILKNADFTLNEPSGTWLQLTSVQTAVAPPAVPPKEGTYWVIDLPEGHRAVWDAAWGFPGSTISEGRITLQIVRTATGYIKQYFGNPPRFEEKARAISLNADEIGTTYYGIGAGDITAPTAGLFGGMFWYVDISSSATGNYTISTSVPDIGGTVLPKGSQWVIRRNINNNGWELLEVGHANPDLIIRSVNFTASQPSSTTYLVVGARTVTLEPAANFQEGHYLDFHLYDGASLTFTGETVNGGSGPYTGSTATANVVIRLWRASGAASWYARQLGSSGGGGSGEIDVDTGDPSTSVISGKSEGYLYFDKNTGNLWIVATLGSTKRWLQII